MYKRVLRIFVFLIFSVPVFLPDISMAFKRDTRCQILKDAIYLSPAPIREYLIKNFQEVHDGIHFIDRNRNLVNAKDDDCIPRFARLHYKNLGKMLKKATYEDDFNAARSFGLVACFVTETISPDNYRTSKKLVADNFTYDGYQKITDIKADIAELVEKYRIPYQGVANQKVTDYLYAVAVNEVADYWVSLWVASGRNPGKLRPVGFLIARKKNKVLKLKFT